MGAVGSRQETDGIALALGTFGRAFPQGLFVAQDGDNAPAAQNFKLVSWRAVKAAVGAGKQVGTGRRALFGMKILTRFHSRQLSQLQFIDGREGIKKDSDISFFVDKFTSFPQRWATSLDVA